jgi:hypothetical protein
MPIRKPWTDVSPETLRQAPPALGVYELGSASGEVVYVGYAGARLRFGLREALAGHFGPTEVNAVVRDSAAKFRSEVNMMYLTRYAELLNQHADLFGDVPAGNREPGERLPRRRPPRDHSRSGTGEA